MPIKEPLDESSGPCCQKEWKQIGWPRPSTVDEFFDDKAAKINDFDNVYN